MSVQQKNFAEGRWAEMSLCEQMANVGSEISRAFSWRNKGKEDLSKRAVNRALELLDLTIASIRGYSRLKELSRVREGLVDHFYGENEFSSSETLWRKYFDHFNYAARRNY